MMAATTTRNSWMVCLREGIEDEARVLGDLHCDDKTRIGKALLLLVTCNEEEKKQLEGKPGVDYVEPNSTAPLYMGDYGQCIQHMTTQDEPVEWMVTVKTGNATEWKEYTKTSLPSVKILDEIVVDCIFEVSASEADMKKMNNHSLVDCVERSLHGRLELDMGCVTRRIGNDIWALSRIAKRDRPLTFSHSEYHFSTKSTGKGVNVFILDSGINVDHPELRKKFNDGIERCTDVKAKEGDNYGHGTAVASLVAGETVGVAPRANMIDVKVTEGGKVKSFDLVKRLEWVKHNSKDKNNCIANISMTFKVGDSPHQSLINQIKCCEEANVIIVAAAGNDSSPASNYLPANLSQCITVASSNDEDHLAEHSNHGECVDVVAPGENVKVANIRGNQDFDQVTGTSFAAPIVSGVIARYLSEVENPGNPHDVATWLKEHSTPDKLAPCGDTPNLIVHAPCSMTGRPCPRKPIDCPQPDPVLPPVPVLRQIE